MQYKLCNIKTLPCIIGQRFFIASTNVFLTIIEVGLRFSCKLATIMRNTRADMKRKEGVFGGWTVKMFFLSGSDWAGALSAGKNDTKKMDAL